MEEVDVEVMEANKATKLFQTMAIWIWRWVV
jgi:hypothetical protein